MSGHDHSDHSDHSDHEHEDNSMPLTKEVKNRIRALTRLQNAHETITQDFEREVRELERKYLQRYKPLYEERAAIVAGEKEPTGEEGEAESDEEEVSDDDEGAVPAKGVPHFWLRALANCQLTASAIEEQDVPILEHLTDIKLEYLPAPEEGYTLEFVFSENPYFSEKSLKKIYRAQTGEGFEDAGLVLQGEGIEIKWNEGKDPTHTVTKKKQKNKKTGQVRMVTKKEKRDSFFHFFNPPQLPDLSELEGEHDEMPEGFAELAEQAQFDMDLGEAIKDKIIPEAVLYYLGIADDEDDDDFGGDDYDEDDDEEDEDDESDEEGAPRGQENPPECKQQ